MARNISVVPTGATSVCLCVGLAAVTACALPATEVKVKTQSMREAFESSRHGDAEAGVPASDVRGQRQNERPERSAPDGPALNLHAGHGAPSSPPEMPSQGWTRAPEVRLAYLYEWIDADGIRHLGEWVLIPVTESAWRMRDGRQGPAMHAAK